MKAQPGFISAQLHRGISESNILTNIAVWQSTAALKAAFELGSFQESLKVYPEGTIAFPHILKRVAVENVCTA
jgi:quinol monooxygenase YgiN